MTDTYGPFAAGTGFDATTEAEWKNLFAALLPGVIRTLDATFDLNRLETYADSTGMQVKIKSGRALIRGHWFKRDAEASLVISPSHATLARIDLIVLRLEPAAADPNKIRPVVITGDPSATPAVPVPIQTATIWDIPLAQVAVAATVSTIAAGNVTDCREYQSAQAGILAAVTRSTVQSLTNGVVSAISFDTSELNLGALWSSTVNPTRLTCRVPGIYIASGGLAYAANAANDRLTVIQRNGATTLAQVRTPGMAADVTAHNLSTRPFVMALNDYIELQGYQASGGALNVAAGAQLGLWRLGAS